MKVKLSKSRFRVVLTEVLPYERPLFFGNKYFAHIMKYYDVTIKDDMLIPQKHQDDVGLSQFLGLLSKAGKDCINYNYLISKDGNVDGRLLTVMHPYHQIKTALFYEKYADLMIHFCGKSRFSIRYPWRVASVLKYKSLYHKVISDDAESGTISQSAKSYFVYRKYSNISKFYDDYQFLNIERNFEHLLKVDIEKCFDTINPEYLSSLIYDFAIQQDGETYKNDFISDFVTLHEEIRKGLPGSEESEAKGIIIGPEVSRIFAEIFLQHIDFLVERKLKDKHELICPKDYRIFRYVDDSFIAAMSIETIRTIMTVINETLAEVGMNVKESKKVLYRERPFIDGISLIKSRLKDLVDKTFENRLSTFKGFKKVQEGIYDAPTYHSFKSFIMELRIIVAETRLNDGDNCNVENNKSDNIITCNPDNPNSAYKDVTSFVLGMMMRRMLVLLKEFNDLYRNYSEGDYKNHITEKGKEIKEDYEQKFTVFCEQLIESLFFILSSDLRMATSISVVKFVDIIQRFLRGDYIFTGNIKSAKFPSYVISDIDEVISSETLKILRHKRFPDKSGAMEVLNLLELQHLMYPRNKIGEEPIILFLENNPTAGILHFFTAFQLIHFAQGKKRYGKLNEKIKPWLTKMFQKFRDSGGADTESLLTVLEILALPEHFGLREDIKASLDDVIDIDSVQQFMQSTGNMFIRWNGYKVYEEIAQRKGQNVY